MKNTHESVSNPPHPYPETPGPASGNAVPSAPGGAPATTSQSAENTGGAEAKSNTLAPPNRLSKAPSCGLAALELIRRGFAVVPIPSRSKAPTLRGWPNLRITEEAALSYFADADGNIGIICGGASAGLVDADLDCTEALSIAPLLLPSTGMCHGRRSKPQSHYWYFVQDGAPPHETFKDPRTGEMLLELRSDGHQTIVPPSTHPCGEPLVWHDSRAPATVPAATLQRTARIAAAACLAARYWPARGSRHECALALAGMLLRRGVAPDTARELLRAVCAAAGDTEPGDRVAAVDSTLTALANSRAATGLPRLTEILGADLAEQIADWCGAGPEAHASTQDRCTAAPVQGWPDDLDEAALHGLAGDFVRLVAPETEAHPVALLVQILVAFGNLIGRTGHFVAEADKHFANLYAVLVGQSSKARKGSSLGHVLRLAEMIDPDWRQSRIMSGLSSGEGLIFNVRDPQFRNEEIKKDGKRTGETVEVQTDEGVADKRLLVIEPEFASVLRVLERDGNTLSAFIRQGWDSGELRVMNKNSPLVATGVHLSIVGHVTADELKRYLNRTEAGNGFANRFLWLCVRRARCLPEGGHVPDSALEALAGRMREAVGFARQYRLLRRTEAAREIWAEVYPELSEGRPGMAGALIARAEAQVMRIAMLYALLDHSDIIDVPHLMAGLALWTYAEQSVGFIFGNALGDPLADDILAAVTSCREGLTRSQIRDCFHRNLSGSRVESAIALLEQGGMVRREKLATDGRPSERIIATSNDTTTKTT